MALTTQLRLLGVRCTTILLGSLFGLGALPSCGEAQPAAAWRNFGANSQHAGLSTTAAQSLDVIHWSTPVDLAPPTGEILIHYGSPVVTLANTVIIPVKKTAAGSYRVDARSGKDGSLIWSIDTDYILPTHDWTPSYSPALGPNDRVYFAGAGGTVYYRDNVDSSAPVGGQLAFFGLATYRASPASFNSTVFVNTPITVDSAGAIYFGFRASGTAPLGLQSGIARIDAAGNGRWVSAATAAGDASVTQVPHQAAPALASDEQTLYVVVAGATGTGNAYLVGLDPSTLVPKEPAPGVPMRVPLKDPRSGGANNALVIDDSSASPMVGPDGDVYYGVLGNPFNGSRGWLLHFSGDLAQTKTPGAFGWDSTPAVVPASAVPSYGGASAYLLFSKYNNYAGTGADWGDGVNRIAVLDPNATEVEPHASSAGLLVMKEVLSIAGPTPDPEFTAQFPHAVREWCINAAAVDPVTRSVMVNSEDGKLYRWDLTTNALSQAVTLSTGIGEAYTPTAIGPDGTVYAINGAILDAVGQRASIAISDASVTEGNRGATNAVFTVTLSPASAQTVTVSYATADGSATADGNDYVSASGTLKFAPGQTTRTISVAVRGDTLNEGAETFLVSLSNPVNATVTRGQGIGTILNDDPLPALTIKDVSVVEGNSGTVSAVFTVTLTPASGQTVTVGYATADGSATVAGNDYLPRSGTLIFAPGETVKKITVSVLGDTVKEANETFFVNLAGAVNATISRTQGRATIVNDDKH